MTPEPRGSARDTLVAVAAVAAAALAAFLPVLATGFTSDDFFILARVKALNGLAHPLEYFRFGFFEYYRPLAFLTHAVDWQVWGLNPVGFHLRSLLLHAACSVLVLLVGRQLLSGRMAIVAALLFAVHPASHEAVYWMAARFDLLATFFTLLAIWCLSGDGVIWRTSGIVAFALGLLSKESAVSLLLIAPAWDVFIGRRDLRAVLRRLLPLLLVVAAYGLVRNFGADLDAAGGGRRLMKAVMAAVALAAILLAAWRRDRRPADSLDARTEALTSWPGVALTAGALTAVLCALLWWPVTAGAAARLVGFVAYATFYAISPVVFPSPPAEWFSPAVARDALPGLLVTVLLAALLVRTARSFARHPDAVFLWAFIAAALIPVSSLTGGLRYLYLATAGVSLLAGWWLERLPRRGRIPAAVLVTTMLVVSLTQLMHAARAWRAGADMTRDAIVLMAGSPPCGTKDVVLLTAPAGIGGVYANLLYESFDVLTGCSPKSFAALLRVVGEDVHVDVKTHDYGVVELRVPDYRGGMSASRDLSHFTEHIAAGRTLVMDTPLGRLEAFPDGTTQVFHLTLNARSRSAERFYYSDGAVRR